MRGLSKRGRLFSNGSSSAGGREFGRLTNSSDESSANISPENVPRASSSMDDDGAPDEPLSPYQKSPWSSHMAPRSSSVSSAADDNNQNALLGSLVREEGHICSLAASGDLLYTGSDSKNIRVWKSHQEFAGFKSHSGLVKAIVIAGEKIFTGHQDGKIRVWRISTKSESLYRRHGTLPTFRDYVKHSVKPSSYIEVGKNRTGLWLKHIDAISCLCLSEDKSLLYSASWDRTFKVWRISDSKCLESVTAHDDVVNSIVAGFDELVFTGSADGTVKIWRREMQGKGTKHFFSQNLLKQECAVTSLAFNGESSVVYCGSSDGVVNFWERENNFQNGGVLRGHKLAVLCLVTAEELVLSGSADMGIYVWKWNGSEHMCVSVLSGHTGPVKCLAVERDRETEGAWILYSGSLDKSVKMWRVTGRTAPGTVLGQASVDNGGSRRGSRRARAATPACTLQDASTYVSQ